MRKLKILLMAVIVLLILGLLSQVVQATDETPTTMEMQLNIYTEQQQIGESWERVGPRPFSEDDGTDPANPGHDVYTISDSEGTPQMVFKIGEDPNQTPEDNRPLDFEKVMYCLRFGMGFGARLELDEYPESLTYKRLRRFRKWKRKYSQLFS